MAKYVEQGGNLDGLNIHAAVNSSEKTLMLEIAKFKAMMENACAETAPHKVCAYIYDLANAFNKFYHETKILAEEDAEKKAGWIALLMLTKGVLDDAIDVLGFSAPEKM